jgi:CheY-like chemotaxis protein
MSAQPRERLLVEGRIDPEHPLLQKPFGADEFQRALALLTPPRKAKQGGVVLLVEDDPLMRSALRVLLETWEYRVLDAGTVGEAARITEAAGAPPVAAVVTDLLLPDGTGDVLVRRLRARPDAGATPAIYLTGFGAGDAVLENAQARAPGVLLQKPFDAQTLRDHLEEVLEEAR